MKKLTWKTSETEYEFESAWLDDAEFERMKASLESDPTVYEIRVIYE